MKVELDTIKKALIMEEREIKTLVADIENELDDVFEVTVKTAQEALATESEEKRKLSKADKIHLLIQIAYRNGVTAGIYYLNEAIKATLEEMEKDSDN